MSKKKRDRDRRPQPPAPVPAPVPTRSCLGWRRWAVVAAVLIGLVWANLALQRRSFYRFHSTGDQRVYIGLAMKLEAVGYPKGYNLREIRITEHGGFEQYTHAPGEKGTLLTLMTQQGAGFYDRPMFHQPPLFPWLLRWSHRRFAAGQPYQVLGMSGRPAQSPAPRAMRAAQFDCCIVPIASAALLVLACFGLGTVVRSTTVGLMAAAILSLAPTYQQAAQRVWADQTLALLVTVGFLAFYLYATRDRVLWLLLSAVSLGLSILVKQTGVIVLLPLLIYPLLRPAGSATGRRQWAALAGFALVVLAIVWPWHQAMIRTFGHPFYAPSQPGISKVQTWFALINQQPWYAYALQIPYQAPLFLLGYAGLAGWGVRRECPAAWRFLSAWFLVFAVVLSIAAVAQEMLGPEPRYMLPAYPALAVLSALVLDRLRLRLAARWNPALGWAVVGALLLIGGGWSLRLAEKHRQFDIIWAPFYPQLPRN